VPHCTKIGHSQTLARRLPCQKKTKKKKTPKILILILALALALALALNLQMHVAEPAMHAQEMRSQTGGCDSPLHTLRINQTHLAGLRFSFFFSSIGFSMRAM
jgi:hypothetical protein